MLNILYVEDDDMNYQVVEHILGRLDAKVSRAYDGAEGVNLSKSLTPDIILMDIGLPGDLSGVDAAEIISSDTTTSDIPIVIISANQTPDTWRRCRKMGCDIYLTKPVRRSLLLRTITQLVNHEDVDDDPFASSRLIRY